MNISFYGGFGLGNFGNEATLQAALDSFHRLVPDAEVNCICSNPEIAAAIHKIATTPMLDAVITGWRSKNRILTVLRALAIGVPSELYRWIEAFRTLRGTDLFIVPGTGLLTDAFGVQGWGPYSLFKWSAVAKLRGCKIAFISVGAGPLYTRTGRWFVKRALSFADFRSYRDLETRNYLCSIDAKVAADRVYPDLAFSLPGRSHRPSTMIAGRRLIVGLGLMLYHRKLSNDVGTKPTYLTYLEQLTLLVQWLLAQGYDIRLLIGELSDESVVAEFKALLKEKLANYSDERIVDGHVESVEDLLTQLSETDAVVATRFHNILLAFVLNKPVISISFHQKCSSLVKDMGLGEYCQEIKHLDGKRLIEQFKKLEKNAESLRQIISNKVEERRHALDEQYRLLFMELGGQSFY